MYYLYNVWIKSCIVLSKSPSPESLAFSSRAGYGIVVATLHHTSMHNREHLNALLVFIGTTPAAWGCLFGFWWDQAQTLALSKIVLSRRMLWGEVFKADCALYSAPHTPWHPDSLHPLQKRAKHPAPGWHGPSQSKAVRNHRPHNDFRAW
jgi:hypothetical protein